MKLIVLCLISLLSVTTAFASIDPILQDEFEDVTKGRSSGVTYAPGVGGTGVVLDNPSDKVEYAAEEFSPHAGCIEFDLKLNQAVTPEHKAWCLLSDSGEKADAPGALILRWAENQGVLEYGISDGKSFRWCRSRKGDWLKDKWYHLKLSYGPEGMNLDIDGRQEGTNTYSGGLAANTPKKLGYDDATYDAPPVVIDNFRTYRSYADYLIVDPPQITLIKDENPPICIITYSLAETSAVMLEIIGRKNNPVKTLIDDAILQAGEYKLNWSPEGLKDGEYTVRLLRATPTRVKGLVGKIKVEHKTKSKDK